MIAVNTLTGESVTGLLIKQMEGKITRDEFITLAGLDPEAEGRYEAEQERNIDHGNDNKI